MRRSRSPSQQRLATSLGPLPPHNGFPLQPTLHAQRMPGLSTPFDPPIPFSASASGRGPSPFRHQCGPGGVRGARGPCRHKVCTQDVRKMHARRRPVRAPFAARISRMSVFRTGSGYRGCMVLAKAISGSMRRLLRPGCFTAGTAAIIASRIGTARRHCARPAKVV